MAIEQLAKWVRERQDDVGAFRVENDGTRDLRFKGIQIGLDREKLGTGLYLEITIWATTGGNIVVHKWHQNQWQGQRDRNQAKVCHSVDEALQFLESEDGYFGSVSRQAWYCACHECNVLEGQDVIEVE